MEASRSYQPERCCDAPTRAGGKCRKPAGFGTDHFGVGRCRSHGGNSPTHRRAAHRQMALAELPAMGGNIDVDPTEALLHCVKREAGRSGWLQLRVEALDPDGVEQVADPHSEVAELVRLEAQSIERLARFAKMALDAGLDERQV